MRSNIGCTLPDRLILSRCYFSSSTVIFVYLYKARQNYPPHRDVIKTISTKFKENCQLESAQSSGPEFCLLTAKKSTWITVPSFLSWPNLRLLSGLCRACKIAIKAAMSNRFTASSRCELGDFNVFLSTKVFLFHLTSFITINSQEVCKSNHSQVHSQLVKNKNRRSRNNHICWAMGLEDSAEISHKTHNKSFFLATFNF